MKINMQDGTSVITDLDDVDKLEYSNGNLLVYINGSSTSYAAINIANVEFYIASDEDTETVTIGNQVWMVKNLVVTHYRNGDPIPQVTDPTEWANLTTGAWCYYNNDPANGAIYGKLYNWYAVNDTRGLAPSGYHVPSDAEWKILEMHLGMSQQEADSWGYRGSPIGAKLAGFYDLWYNGELRNHSEFGKSGFSGSPGGNRSYYGGFLNLGYYSGWWSASEYSSSFALYRHLYYYYAYVYRYYYIKRTGFSVRCIRD
jgi:uncharacterized protein (TIGR02145 family)